MLRQMTHFVAVATISLSAAYTWVATTPANAAVVRAAANMKVKETSKSRMPFSTRGFALNPANSKRGRDLGKYNRMFEMY
jgi:hypothetical protein